MGGLRPAPGGILPATLFLWLTTQVASRALQPIDTCNKQYTVPQPIDTVVLLQTRTSDPSHPKPFLELVVASYCEDTEWFRKFDGPVSVYAKLPHCVPELRRSLAVHPRGRLVELPNRGREQHSYVRHILDNWDNLAPYTAFVQGGGQHNGVHALDAISDFLAREGLQRAVNVVPIVPRNANGFVLYRDADQDENKVGVDPLSNLEIFPKEADYADRARAMFVSLFGGTACEAPPMVFAAGVQLIVRREAIRARPLAFWEFIEQSLAGECEAYGYDLERMWLHIFNPELKTREDLSLPRMCFGGGHLMENVVTWKCDKGYIKQTGITALQSLGKTDRI